MTIPREVNRLIKKGELKGSIPAMMTFWREGPYFTEKEQRKQIMLLEDLKPFSDAILVGGTTGQGPALLSHAKAVLSTQAVMVTGLPVIVGISANNLERAIEEIGELEDELTPTTFLVATGFYNKPGPIGVRDFYLRLADRVQGNIIIYNIPGRTDGTNIPVEVSVALSKHPRIIGEKEASGNLEQIKAKVWEVDKDYAVMAGDDTIVAELLSFGGKGVISATANYAPGISKRMVEAGLRRDRAEAERLQREYFTPAASAVFAGRNPITLAYMFGSAVALPLSLEDLTEDQKVVIDRTVKRFGNTEGFIDLGKY